MNDLRTAAQQALERLRKYHYGNGFAEDAECIADLEAALAQQAEPVLVQGELPPRYVARSPIQAEPLNLTDPAVQKRLAAQWGYVHEAQQAEPVQDQRCRAEPRSDGDFVCDCKIGECLGRSAEPAQEPVAYIHRQGNHWEVSERHLDSDEKSRGWTEEPLYTAPPQRQPLTAQQLDGVIERHVGGSEITDDEYASMEQFARAVERAHGIKE